MATDPTDRAGCLALARRVVGGGADWPPEQWEAQLDDDALLRGSPQRSYYRPYRTAIAYLVNPERVKSRTEGQVTEQFVDAAATLAYLREQDGEWTMSIPPAADANGDGKADELLNPLDTRISWGGWD